MLDTTANRLLHKCPELKSKDFSPQEKRERKFCKTVGVYGCVRACMQLGGGVDWQKGRKIERQRERKNERKKMRK